MRIEIRNLSKSFGNHKLFDHISLCIEERKQKDYFYFRFSYWEQADVSMKIQNWGGLWSKALSIIYM